MAAYYYHSPQPHTTKYIHGRYLTYLLPHLSPNWHIRQNHITSQYHDPQVAET